MPYALDQDTDDSSKIIICEVRVNLAVSRCKYFLPNTADRVTMAAGKRGIVVHSQYLGIATPETPRWDVDFC